MTRVMIVEDQAMLRDSLRMAIDAQNDMEVVALIGNAADVMARMDTAKPDLILMDVVTENDSSGIRATKQVKERYPNVRVVVMTGLPDITFASQARAAGADSFVYKNMVVDDLLAIIRSTVDGYATFPAQTGNDLADAHLTDEELDILRLTCEAKSRREIAEELYMSEGTVKRRISEILAKTGYDSIMRLAMRAVSDGYIVPNLK